MIKGVPFAAAHGGAPAGFLDLSVSPGGWGLSTSARVEAARWREVLAVGLRRRGLEPLASSTNFLLVPIDRDTDGFIAGLAAQSVAVRACNDFGMAGVVRIAVTDPAGLARLLAALDNLRRCAA
ncbi:MAG: hypothetical protein ABSB75_01875 [Candidatus Limnocylindrales bacterium]